MNGARGYIQLIATGGTISIGPDGVLRAGSMIKMARRLPANVPIRGEDFATVPSSCMTPDDHRKLAERVNGSLSDDGCLGVVITHGTDSIEETAVALEMLCAPSKPVVVTGAMVPSKDSGADGPGNVADAIEYALCDDAGGAGVVVVMNSRVHAAFEVQKLHTISKDAFSSGDAGPIGLVAPGDVELVRTPTRLGLKSGILDDSVELIKLTAGGGARLIDCAAKGGARGIVIEAFGVGNLPEHVIESAESARQGGAVVLVTTRVGSGPILICGSAIKAGLIPAMVGGRRVSGLAARIMLMAMLGAGLGGREISDLLSAGGSEG